MPDDTVTQSLDEDPRDADDSASTSAARVLDPATGRSSSRAAADPETLGRYRIIERLGEGGMGVVFRAHDPDLSRDVAIKQVHRHMARSDSARDRLRREAQALAEVSHPNVVQVYDVGDDGHTVYISMELIDGVDLQQWLEQTERTWTEILAMLVTAGRGLVAAHERGLVHRDFKPSNVLVGDDGRPRVVDFGLAAVSEAASTASGSGSDLDTSGRSWDRRPLTKTGTAMGTPAYMAPEQHRGELADARSDQYAFCMSLYESLYGVRPFHGTSIEALAVSKQRYELPSPEGRLIPRRLLSALRRGLHPDRDHRWPSMTALLEALERAGRPRLRPSWRTGAVLIAAGGLSTAALLALRAPDPAATRCPPASERLAGVWDSDQAAALQHAVTSSGLAYAEQTWSRVDERLGRYVDSWGAAYDQVCAAMHDPTAEQAALDRHMVCLGARRDELASLVEVLQSGEDEVIRSAVGAVTELRPVADCEHGEASEPVDASQAAALEQIHRDLLQAEALGKVARFDEGLVYAAPALERATSLDVPPLRARALLLMGQLEKGKGESHKAEQHLSESTLLAASIGRDDLAARAAITLVDVRGAWQARYDEALEWNRHARASIERMGGDADLEVRRLTALGYLELTLGHFDEAATAFEGSLTLGRETWEAGHPRLASAQSNLSSALVRIGRYDEALTAAREALAAGQQAFGRSHPEVGLMHGRLANAWFRQGEYESSIEHSKQAIAILESTLGPQHPNVLAFVVNLAQVEYRVGRLDEAQATFERALPGVAGSPNEAIVLAGLTDLARDREDYPRSLEYARRSRELRETLYGAQGTMVVVGLLYEGLALALVGRDAEAQQAFERVRQSADVASLPPPITVVLWAYEGRAHLLADRPQQALEPLRTALEQQEAIGAEPLDRAEVRFHLAQALWALGRHDEARAELAIVGQQLAPLGDAAEYRRRPVRAWIEREGVGVVLDGPR